MSFLSLANCSMWTIAQHDYDTDHPNNVSIECLDENFTSLGFIPWGDLPGWEEEDFLEKVDPSFHSIAVLLKVIQIFQGIISFLSLVLNGLVIFMIFQYPKLRSSGNGVTNIYLANIAFAHLCYSVCTLIGTITSWVDWKLGNFSCKVYYTATAFGYFLPSIVIAAISIDTYLAVRGTPSEISKWRTPLNARMVGLLAWAFSTLFVIPITTNAKTITEWNSEQNCALAMPDAPEMSGEAILLAYLSVFGFMIPFVVTLMFSLLLLAIKTNLTSHDSSLTGENIISMPMTVGLSERVAENTNKKLMLILLSFQFLFWAPRLIIQWASMLLHSVAEHEFLSVFHSLTSCAANLTVASNPFLCMLLYEDFRKCYKRTFPWCSRNKDFRSISLEERGLIL